MNAEHCKAYTLLQEQQIDDIHAHGYLLRHNKSGARVLLLENEDDNKVFNIAFRTPPADSTGVAHILEHSVLCGSREFPLKDPFVELVKGSLNTFLNAMTYPDKTMYPVASTNDADFQNLMHVYLDAVFYPNIYKNESIFRQEGWHYELTDKDAPLIYNGVVYNEMKGAFSSPEQILYRKITDSLFPDTIYSVESGGDPDVIPELTYEQFLDFHRKYYHPSNSYIYLYGNMDVAEKLAFIDEEYLCHYDNAQVDSAIARQLPFKHSTVTRGEYPIGNDDREENAAYMAYSWVIGDSLDAKLCLAFQILEYALMDAPGAPLKQALLDQKLGEDIYGMFETSLLQPYLSIIIKNMNEADRDQIVQIIRTELAKLADVKVTTSNSMSDEEEEELWSYIAGNVNIEREFEEKEEAENILNKVDKVFQELRAKQQPIVSDVITTKIWLCLEDSEQQYSFISKEVAEEWNKKGTLPTQRELARKYGRDEASISRTVRTFLEKLKREIEQER